MEYMITRNSKVMNEHYFRCRGLKIPYAVIRPYRNKHSIAIDLITTDKYMTEELREAVDKLFSKWAERCLDHGAVSVSYGPGEYTSFCGIPKHLSEPLMKELIDLYERIPLKNRYDAETANDCRISARNTGV